MTSASNPYPGLRPFRDDESDFFFGRDRQIREIVQRLASDQHFVALIGPSGSGKSSLIRAGVIPALRAYELPKAGGAWLPVIFTPGTNPASDEDSPLYRLACAFLSAIRREEFKPEWREKAVAIADVLRGRGGLQALVEGHMQQLDPKLFPAGNRTNFLFLIDQFEELFHSTHHEWADDEDLIRRVVEHAEQPHPRIYVVMTMRSEFLNYCPRHAGLTEQINRALMLLGRLNEDEIREAIAKPARRALFLEWKKLPEDKLDQTQLPEDVAFDEDNLTECLVKATNNVSEKADDLPLLQHLLFRLWEAAVVRAKNGGEPFPKSVTLVDLTNVVPETETIPDDDVTKRPDLLSIALKRWCETLFNDLANRQGDRKYFEDLFKDVFCRLALVDDSGNFTQERIRLDDLAGELSKRKGRVVQPAELRRILSPFVRPHAYLTIEEGEGDEWNCCKVAHESLIRSWPLFRDWIEKERKRFWELDWLIEQCDEWSKADERGKKANDYLLNVADLQRATDLWFVRTSADKRQSWLHGFAAAWRWYARTPEGKLEFREDKRFARVRRSDPKLLGEHENSKLCEFVRASEASLNHLALFDKLRWTLGPVILLGAALGFFRWQLNVGQGKLLERENGYFQSFAIAITTTTNLSQSHEQLADPLLPLKQELVAARHWLETRNKVPHWTEEWLGWAVAGMEARRDRLRRGELLAEAAISERLWAVLTNALWPAEAQKPQRTAEVQNSQAPEKTTDRPKAPDFCKDTPAVRSAPEPRFGKSSTVNQDHGPDAVEVLAVSADKKLLLAKIEKDNTDWVELAFASEGSPCSQKHVSTQFPKTTTVIPLDLSSEFVLAVVVDNKTRLQAFSIDWAARELRLVSDLPWSQNMKFGELVASKAIPATRERSAVFRLGKSLLAIPAVASSGSYEPGPKPDRAMPLPVKARDECEKESPGPGKNSEFCLELDEGQLERGGRKRLARLFRVMQADRPRIAYPIAKFSVGEEIDSTADWLLVMDETASTDAKPGWIYLPLMKVDSAIRTYMAYPWSVKARSELAQHILLSSGDTRELDLSLSKRYSMDYNLIKNGPMNDQLKQVEEQVCAMVPKELKPGLDCNSGTNAR